MSSIAPFPTQSPVHGLRKAAVDGPNARVPAMHVDTGFSLPQSEQLWPPVVTSVNRRSLSCLTLPVKVNPGKKICSPPVTQTFMFSGSFIMHQLPSPLHVCSPTPLVGPWLSFKTKWSTDYKGVCSGIERTNKEAPLSTGK